MATRKVFISYRSVDRERVRVVAEALNAAGINVWWDQWEIRAGENFVSKINEGLNDYHCGVVCLSNALLDSGWQWEEITILKDLFVKEKRTLIPLILDPDVKIPPVLGVHSAVRVDQIQQLIDAIEGRNSKPTPGKRTERPPSVRFLIALHERPDGSIGVSAEVDGKALGAEVAVRPGAAFQFSYNEFLQQVPSARMGGLREGAAARGRELVKLGDAVGRVVFVGAIGEELGSKISEASGRNQDIELGFKAGASRLLSIPFEAARLADGRIPALLPGVFTARRLALTGSGPDIKHNPPAGPLRVLVAVGAPDEGKTSSAVLDGEQELQTILDAVEAARQLGNAYVRVLEVGSPEQIGIALRERSYHVLHVSGHGNRGVLELEDEDGRPVLTDAARLAKEIRESGHSAPLVFLASSHGGLGDEGKAAFAQGLLESGVPSVLAMQTAVSDGYATALAGRFYEELSRMEEPLASRALALARRQLEEQRQKGGTTGAREGALPEYATASLFLRREEQPVLDRGLELVKVQEPAPLPSPDAVPMLKVGELIGRRREMRELVRGLLEGQLAGAQILGTGGVGKSALAGRVMQRMAERGWPVVTVSGAWNMAKIAAKLGAVLWKHPQAGLAKLASDLNDPEAPDDLRIEWLSGILSGYTVLLVLDNFEDLLAPAGTGFSEGSPEKLFKQMLRSAKRAKLLITCRYPVPDVEDFLQRVDLGPLSRAETRKMMLRRPALAEQSS